VVFGKPADSGRVAGDPSRISALRDERPQPTETLSDELQRGDTRQIDHLSTLASSDAR